MLSEQVIVSLKANRFDQREGLARLMQDSRLRKTLLVFGDRRGIPRNTAADKVCGHPSINIDRDGADCYVEFGASVRRPPTHRAAIHPARARLDIANNLHRAHLRRARHRSGREQCLQYFGHGRGGARRDGRCHLPYRRVTLRLEESFDMNRTHVADAAHVIA